MRKQLVRKIPAYPKRPLDAHKGSMGRLILLAGSRNMPGAAVLAAKGALRSGVGLVTLAVAESILPVVQAHIVEATFLPLPTNNQGMLAASAAEHFLSQTEKAQAVVLGPGLGQNAEVAFAVRKIIKQCKLPMVVDADALNIIGTRHTVLKQRDVPTVLTPHPGEMGRLLGISATAVQEHRDKAALQCAQATRCVVLLKGQGTIVTDGSKFYRNTTGNPGMAKGGCGDVLAGYLGGLLARKMNALDAAVLATYRHGLAGDKAAQQWGEEAMSASDLLDNF